MLACTQRIHAMYSGLGGLLFPLASEALLFADEVDGIVPPCPVAWSCMMCAMSSRFRSRRRVMRARSWAREEGEVGGW